jgi:hypothetical protein
LGQAASTTGNAIVDVASGVGNTVGGTAKNVGQTLSNLASDAGKTVKGAADKTVGALEGAAQKAGDYASEAGEAVKNYAVEAGEDFWEGAKGKDPVVRDAKGEVEVMKTINRGLGLGARSALMGKAYRRKKRNGMMLSLLQGE